jgi:2,5-diamino-6-(ribosylamino)-4(3H)-pyrimidinone 5'-phosphate reductase
MRPFVLVNVAMSADGKLSTRGRRQVKISGKDDFARVDKIKAESDAIMVGIGTVLADDPSLTVKSPDRVRWRKEQGMDEHPVRVIVDSTLKTPTNASILTKGEGKRVVACSKSADSEKIREFEKYATVICTGEERVDLSLLMDELGAIGIRRLMVEGGGRLIWSLFEAGLVDEFSCFVGNMIIGGSDAPTPADGDGFVLEQDFPGLTLREAKRMDEGVLLVWNVKKSR